MALEKSSYDDADINAQRIRALHHVIDSLGLEIARVNKQAGQSAERLSASKSGGAVVETRHMDHTDSQFTAECSPLNTTNAHDKSSNSLDESNVERTSVFNPT